MVATMQAKQVTIRAIGNSKVVVLPKAVLAQAGLEGARNAEVCIENGLIVLRKPTRPARRGWADAAQKIAAVAANELVMGEFGNVADAELQW